ncbi:AIR synthase [Sphingobacteriaceae bacterium]|nr:AIR synthase [Sphingobacteriaceae bacterium]
MKEAGKITKTDFEKFFAGKLGADREEVLTGPSFGVDVSVIDLGSNKAMLLTSDPLSLIPSLGLQESAWLSVHLMANDMATTGFAPMYGQFVLNLPLSLTEKDFKTYWEYIHKFCRDINVSITGGHTGSIEGQNSTIAGGGTFITVAERDKVLTSKNARAGDFILMTKQCAISSSAILAMSFPQTVKSKLGNELYLNACDLFYKTSSLQEALITSEFNSESTVVSSMHDVTEGGVLGAVYEMAVASGKGIRIDNSKLAIKTTEEQICRLFSLDPRYCIGAGSMIITVEKNAANTLITALAKNNIACTIIGEVVEPDQGIKILDHNGELQPLLYQQKDPYWAAFFKALKNNWN